MCLICLCLHQRLQAVLGDAFEHAINCLRFKLRFFVEPIKKDAQKCSDKKFDNQPRRNFRIKFLANNIKANLFCDNCADLLLGDQAATASYYSPLKLGVRLSVSQQKQT